MSNCQDKVLELSEQIKEYEELIEQIRSVKKTIGTITGGPYTEQGQSYYRVSASGSEAIYKYVPFGSKELTPAELEPETEVLIIEQGPVSTISSVIPQQLYGAKQVNEFELTRWDKIGGLDDQIEQIREAVELPIKHKDLAEELNIPLLKGILLYGPPGCGKTMIAKAIAHSILEQESVPEEAFIYIKGAELLSPYVGAAERSIQDIFDRSRAYMKDSGQQGVIFIDEADAILPSRGSRRSSDVDKTIVPTFLSEMDGLEGHSPMVILCTNMESSLDSAVLRPGRIDLKIAINRPTKNESEQIYKIHLGQTKLAEDPQELACKASDYIYSSPLKNQVSGALIANSVSGAARLAMKRRIQDRRSSLGIIYKDIEQSLKTV